MLILIWRKFIYDDKNYHNFYKRQKVNKESVKIIFKSGFSVFGFTFLNQYLLNAPKYAIDNYLEDNYQTIFGIIVMPATVIGLVAQFLIHPYLNSILELYEKRDSKGFYKIIMKLILSIIVIGVISSILAYLLGPEVLGIIYGIDLKTYRWDLLIIIIASTLYTIGVIYSSVLTTIRDTFSQFIIYICITIFALIVSNYLTKSNKIEGAVIAYFIIMLLQFLAYSIYANVKIKKILKKAKMLDYKEK